MAYHWNLPAYYLWSRMYFNSYAYVIFNFSALSSQKKIAPVFCAAPKCLPPKKLLLPRVSLKDSYSFRNRPFLDPYFVSRKRVEGVNSDGASNRTYLRRKNGLFDEPYTQRGILHEIIGRRKWSCQDYARLADNVQPSRTDKVGQLIQSCEVERRRGTDRQTDRAPEREKQVRKISAILQTVSRHALYFLTLIKAKSADSAWPINFWTTFASLSIAQFWA